MVWGKNEKKNRQDHQLVNNFLAFSYFFFFNLYQANSSLFCLPFLYRKSMNWILIYMNFASEKPKDDFNVNPHRKGRRRSEMELRTAKLANILPSSNLNAKIHSPIYNWWVEGEKHLRLKCLKTKCEVIQVR